MSQVIGILSQTIESHRTWDLRMWKYCNETKQSHNWKAIFRLCSVHAVWSIRVWSTRVKISPVLKIFGKIRGFSRSKYWTLLAQGSVWQYTTQYFWHIVSAFKFRLQKCYSIIKTLPVFFNHRRHLSGILHNLKSGLQLWLFCFIAVFLHS